MFACVHMQKDIKIMPISKVNFPFLLGNGFLKKVHLRKAMPFSYSTLKRSVAKQISMTMQPFNSPESSKSLLDGVSNCITAY